MIGNIKFALLFALLFSNFFIEGMDKISQCSSSNGPVSAQTYEDLNEELTELFKEYKNEVIAYNETNVKAAQEFFQELMAAIINNDINNLSNLFDNLQNIKRPSLFLDLVLNMTDEDDNTPLLLAINLEKADMVGYLKEAANKYFVCIDNNRALKYVQSTVFSNNKVKNEICAILSLTNSLREKHRNLQISLEGINWGIPKDDQNKHEIKIEAESFVNLTLEIAS